MDRSFDRRTLLKMGLATAGVFGVGTGWLRHVHMQNELVLRLAGWGAQSDDVTTIGRAYLEGQPEEADRDTLTRLLATSLNLFPYGMSDDELRQRSRAQIERDFADADTLTVQGWILSRTELRLCALAALLHG